MLKRPFLFLMEKIFNKLMDLISQPGPVLADIFMVHLENNIVLSLHEYFSFWKRYLDDIRCFLKIGTINYIITALNNFDANVTFTYEKLKQTLNYLFWMYFRSRKITISLLEYIAKQSPLM